MKPVFILCICLLLRAVAFSQNLSHNDWLEDLQVYKTELEKRHIDVYNKISRADFEAMLEEIKAHAGEKPCHETLIEIMRLTRKIGDGHTAVSTQNMDIHFYPIKLKNFDGSWRVVGCPENAKHLLGTELLEIDGQAIRDIAQKVGEVAQFVENNNSLQVRTTQNLINAELLYGLKITRSQRHADFVFRNDAGKRIPEQLEALKRPEYKRTPMHEIEISVPEISVPENPANENFWYAPIRGTKGLYIHFESYPSFEKMLTIAEEIVGFILQNNCRQLVIDLRNNGGGDLYVGLVLANALNLADPIDWKSGVYVLADKVTFSAAASNTALFRELLNAKIVGEPTGSNPTGYQDMDTFELPHSKLVICYSKRLFRIQEKSTPGVLPDIPLNYEWEKFSAGKDNMLERVLKEIGQ